MPHPSEASLRQEMFSIDKDSIPFSILSHHKEDPYKVHGVGFVFYNEKYCILCAGVRRLIQWM